MQVPLEISFHQLGPSKAIETRIRQKMAKLERLYSQIVSAHVLIEPSHRNQSQGNLFHVRIRLGLPGHEIIVDRDPPEHQAHEDAYVSIRDAFESARRQLEDLFRNQFRSRKRQRLRPPHGIVTKIFFNEGYGFLLTAEGREIYFHENSVLNGRFQSLELGDEVRFAEEEGDKGPQASSVSLVGNSGHHFMMGGHS